MTHQGPGREGGFSLVELLVVIMLTAVIGGAIVNVVMTTMRTSSFTEDMRTVMDDGRISLERIRKELRAARRVLDTGSTDASIRFWLDEDQDGEMTTEEVICYRTAAIPDGSGYELLRWTGAADDCAIPATGTQSIARTLVQPGGVFSYDPEPSVDPTAPRTRLVKIRLVLDARTQSGPDQLVVETTVRLRNVE